MNCETNTFLNFFIFNTIRLRQNGGQLPDDIFKCIFLNENVRILLKLSLKFVLEVRINNIPALVWVMAWCRPGDKPLSEPMMLSSLICICVTRPQRVNICFSMEWWVNMFISWHMMMWIWVNTGSGNGLLPNSTKPLPELLLTYHQRCSLAFNWRQFHINGNIFEPIILYL